MLDTGFLERLNTLLANGEVPGLFEVFFVYFAGKYNKIVFRETNVSFIIFILYVQHLYY